MDCYSTGEHTSGHLIDDQGHAILESQAEFGMVELSLERVVQAFTLPTCTGLKTFD